MPYKLICIDIDGTLIDSNYQICDYNRKMIQRANDAGLVVALVTGRRYYSTVPYAHELGLNVPLVCFNGGLIVDYKTKKILHQVTLERDYASHVMTMWGETEAPIFVYQPSLQTPNIYHQNRSSHPRIKGYLEFESERIISVQDIAQAVEFPPLCVKTFGFFKHIDACFKTYDNMQHQGARWLKTQDVDGTHFLEVYPEAAQKANGLKWLSSYCGIQQDEIIAIGDNLNDIDMLEWAGLGIAMGNAHPQVKAVADEVTDDHNRSGVGKALAKVLDLT